MSSTAIVSVVQGEVVGSHDCKDVGPTSVRHRYATVAKQFQSRVLYRAHKDSAEKCTGCPDQWPLLQPLETELTPHATQIMQKPQIQGKTSVASKVCQL